MGPQLDVAPSPVASEDAQNLLSFVAARDVPCPACGYSLRGLRGACCPECGERLELRVGLSEPRMRLWIGGLVGLAAGAGFNGLLLIYAGIMMWGGGRMRGRGFLDPFVLHNLVGALVGGGLLTLWLVLRRRIRTMPAGVRALLAALAWALAIVNVALFAVYVH
jgi:hypothetical protein